MAEIGPDGRDGSSDQKKIDSLVQRITNSSMDTLSPRKSQRLIETSPRAADEADRTLMMKQSAQFMAYNNTAAEVASVGTVEEEIKDKIERNAYRMVEKVFCFLKFLSVYRCRQYLRFVIRAQAGVNAFRIIPIVLGLNFFTVIPLMVLNFALLVGWHGSTFMSSKYLLWYNIGMVASLAIDVAFYFMGFNGNDSSVRDGTALFLTGAATVVLLILNVFGLLLSWRLRRSVKALYREVEYQRATMVITDDVEDSSTGAYRNIGGRRKESKLRRLGFGEQRVIQQLESIKKQHTQGEPVQTEKFASNTVITSKYTFYNFIFMFLALQLSRIANAYTVVIVILCFFDFSPVSPAASLTPLLIVFVTAAVKDVSEDFKRKKADKRLNGRPTTLMNPRRGYDRPTPAEWKDVQVGDVVLVKRDEPVPSDLLVLCTSRSDGRCYVETAELDGETNLKLRSSLKKTKRIKGPADLLHNYHFSLTCGGPSANLFEFEGALSYHRENAKELTKQSTPNGSSKDGLAAGQRPRSSTAESEESEAETEVDGKDLGAAGPDSFSKDRKASSESSFQRLRPMSISPADCSSADLHGSLQGPTSPTSSTCQRAPSTHSDSQWRGQPAIRPVAVSKDFLSETESVSAENMLWRGTVLRSTEWVLGITVYTGTETRIEQNACLKSIKRTKTEMKLNQVLVLLLVTLLSIAIACTLGNNDWQLQANNTEPWYISPPGTEENDEFIFVSYVILYNSLIPLSLYVTMEAVRFAHARFIEYDLEMYDEETDSPAIARNSNINEDLGQIEYIFADKTGTLTCNEMLFAKCTVAGLRYGDPNPDAPDVSPREGTRFNDSRLLERLRGEHKTAEEIHEFLLLLALCNTVVPEIEKPDDKSKGEERAAEGDDMNLVREKRLSKTVTKQESVEETELQIPSRYQSASPDELCLVQAAKDLGYILLSRDGHKVKLQVLGEVQDWEILNVIDFNSDRKRMTVICRGPDRQIRLFCKGADSVIFQRLREDFNRGVLQITKGHLQDYATEGLRTLSMAMSILDPKIYEKWSKEYNTAMTAVTGRAEKAALVSEKIEVNLYLLGASAIEDRLQEGVSEAISTLRQAGIKFWMLTGDKQETAISIGLSTSTIDDDMELIVLQERTKLALRMRLERLYNEIVDDTLRWTSEHDSVCDVVLKGVTRVLSEMFESISLAVSGHEVASERRKSYNERTRGYYRSMDRRYTGDGSAARIEAPAKRRVRLTGDGSTCKWSKSKKAEAAVDEQFVETPLSRTSSLGERARVDSMDSTFQADQGESEPFQGDSMPNLESSGHNLGDEAEDERKDDEKRTDPSLPRGSQVPGRHMAESRRGDSDDEMDSEMDVRVVESLSDLDREPAKSFNSPQLTPYKLHDSFGQEEYPQVAEELEISLEDTDLAEEEDFDYGMVVDGSTLRLALEDDIKYLFMAVARQCKSVICCRCSPAQKAAVVSLVTEPTLMWNAGATSLAIGDGANDVPMIQRANVGVGISGKEGRQAVLNSDFAIAKFRFLRRLLLVHGNYSYKRISKLILFSIMKNMALSFSIFFYARMNKYSGQLQYFDLLFTFYNALFTTVPIVAIGMFNQDISPAGLMMYPSLYVNGLGGRSFNLMSSIGWSCLGVWHAFVAYQFAFTADGYYSDYTKASSDPDRIRYNSETLGMWHDGTASYTYLIFASTAQVALLTSNWTFYNIMAVVSMLVGYVIFIFLLCSISVWFPSVDIFSSYEAAHIAQDLVTTPWFWFGLVVCTVVAVLPNYILKAGRVLFYPEPSHLMREWQMAESTEAAEVAPMPRRLLRMHTGYAFAHEKGHARVVMESTTESSGDDENSSTQESSGPGSVDEDERVTEDYARQRSGDLRRQGNKSRDGSASLRADSEE